MYTSFLSSRILSFFPTFISTFMVHVVRVQGDTMKLRTLLFESICHLVASHIRLPALLIESTIAKSKPPLYPLTKKIYTLFSYFIETEMRSISIQWLNEVYMENRLTQELDNRKVWFSFIRYDIEFHFSLLHFFLYQNSTIIH